MKKINPLLIIALVILIIYFGPKLQLFAVDIPSAKLELAKEYTTIWADDTDENFGGYIGCQDSCNYNPDFPKPVCWTPQTCGDAEKFYEGLKIFGGNNFFTYVDYIQVDPSSNVRTAQKFKGQEVVMLTTGGSSHCFVYGFGKELKDTTTFWKFSPRTFDNLVYDIYEDGLKVGEKDFTSSNPDGIQFGIYCSSGNAAQVRYFGYKARFECDLSSDEVWIQEQFAEQFSIEDLSFMPTKFCHSTRPFVLRDLVLGETPITRQEGIERLNQGLVVPDPKTPLQEGQIIIVNYATYMVPGILNPCAPNEANVKVGDTWVCQSVIEPITIIQECETAEDCTIPCEGMTVECINNNCIYDGECLSQPIPEPVSIWSLINSIFEAFFNFIKSLFGG